MNQHMLNDIEANLRSFVYLGRDFRVTDGVNHRDGLQDIPALVAGDIYHLGQDTTEHVLRGAVTFHSQLMMMTAHGDSLIVLVGKDMWGETILQCETAIDPAAHYELIQIETCETEAILASHTIPLVAVPAELADMPVSPMRQSATL